MNATIGWALAVLGVALGYVQFGWHGVLLAVSGIVFWLLLQFTQTLRVLRTAGASPKGMVPSAVMLQSRLQVGQRLLDVVKLSRSLGHKLSDKPESYAWADESGARVTVVLHKGRVSQWTLERPADAGADAPGA
ncbi:MAG: hypothetical protein JNL87_23210 [Burkholderiaceae bacterium]|nr:hypothetical protein [Burkholderiaceae bacterium]